MPLTIAPGWQHDGIPACDVSDIELLQADRGATVGLERQPMHPPRLKDRCSRRGAAICPIHLAHRLFVGDDFADQRHGGCRHRPVG